MDVVKNSSLPNDLECGMWVGRSNLELFGDLKSVLARIPAPPPPQELILFMEMEKLDKIGLVS